LFLNNPDFGKASLLLSATMVLIFLSLGCLFFFTTSFMGDAVFGPNRKYIACVFWGWAVYRSFTIWTKYKRFKQEKNDEE
jgi:hypothetical protein